MGYGWIDFLTLVGSIGLFLYGMKLMSEGLQKIAGEKLRGVLAAMTKSRFTGMLTGVMVTALVQSSSATTVMIVSFVNAGLITLAESMAVIMGANVGTTATTWIIAILGFKFNISAFVMPLIAISLPFFNSAKAKNNSWGEFIIGFALLFLGLDILKQSVPNMADYPAALDFMTQYSSYGYLSILLFMFIGMILTMIVQASSAAFTIALLMCANGWINFGMGCALVLGSNIGTCITPVLASLSANTMAKRAAMGHLLFNVVGTIWTIALYYPFMNLIAYLCIEWGMGDPELSENASMGMTMFHTVFNVVNLMLMLPLTKQFVKVVSHIIPDEEAKDETFKLQFINKGIIGQSGDLSLLQSQREISRYAEETYKMFEYIRLMLSEPLGSERQLELHALVRSMENDSDRAEVEIAQFLNQISPKTLSQESEMVMRKQYKVVDELESVADCICRMATILKFKSDQRLRFTDQMNTDVRKMHTLTDSALLHMMKGLEEEATTEDERDRIYNVANNIEGEINNYRNKLRTKMLDMTSGNQTEYQQSSTFLTLINEYEKCGDHIMNVIENL